MTNELDIPLTPPGELSPEQIAAMAAEIRAGWSAAERKSRVGKVGVFELPVLDGDISSRFDDR